MIRKVYFVLYHTISYASFETQIISNFLREFNIGLRNFVVHRHKNLRNINSDVRRRFSTEERRVVVYTEKLFCL